MSNRVHIKAEQKRIVATGLSLAVDHFERLAAMQFHWLHVSRPLGGWHETAMRLALDEMRHAHKIRARVQKLFSS